MRKKNSHHDRAANHLSKASHHYAKAQKHLKDSCDPKKMMEHEKKEKKLINKLSKMHRKY